MNRASQKNKNTRKNSTGRRTQQMGLCALSLTLGMLGACGNDTSGGMLDMGGGGGDGGGGTDDGGAGAPITVTVLRSGPGMGKITSQPAGISCDGTGACSAMFPANVPLTLTAQGIASSFSAWTGACAGQGAVCQITPTADATATASFAPLVCTPDKLCWEAPLPFGMDLRDVTTVAPNEVWAVGTGGSIVHYDGTTWSLSPSGTRQDLTGISASSATNIWVSGGQNGLVLRGNGTTWTPVPTGNNSPSNAVYTASPTAVIVGNNTSNLLHYNGTTWTSFASGGRAGIATILDLSGTAANNVYASGSDNVVTRWNGTTWSAYTRDITRAADGIFGVSATEGYYLNTLDGYIYRSTGGAMFTRFSSPVANPSGTSGLTKVWGTSPNNFFTSGPPGILYRYDGTKWNTIATTATDIPAYAKGAGFSGSNTNMWAVGGKGVVTHWDGTTATTQRSNVFKGNVAGVWGQGPSLAWLATGSGGTMVQYNGAGYVESSRLVMSGGSKLVGVGGSSATDVWVGGSDGGTAVIYRNTGSGWTKGTLPQQFLNVDSSVNVIYAASPTLAWAAGENSAFPLKWNGTSWQLDFSMGVSMSPIRGIWGSGPNDVWLVGGSELLHHDGVKWAKSSAVTVPLFSLSGTSATDVWAGAMGGVYHFDGTSWAGPMAIAGSVGEISSIAAAAPNDVWFTDVNANVFKWNGTAFQQVTTTLPATGAKLKLYATDSNNVLFAGPGVLTYRK